MDPVDRPLSHQDGTMLFRPRLPALPNFRKPTGSFRLVGLSIVIGVLTGVLVAAVQQFVVFAQRAMLGFAAERRIALPDHASYLRILLALAFSAILVTLLSRLIARWKVKEAIDAVGASALNGGRMGWYDATGVVIPILASVCFGASVGIEVAVTQLGAVLASPPRSATETAALRPASTGGCRRRRGHRGRVPSPIAGMLYAYELLRAPIPDVPLSQLGLEHLTKLA